jgi:hypothetical protein
MTAQKRRRLTDDEIGEAWAKEIRSPDGAPADLCEDHLQAREDVKHLRDALVDFGARLFAKVKVGDGESFAEIMVIIDEMRALVTRVDP